MEEESVQNELPENGNNAVSVNFEDSSADKVEVTNEALDGVCLSFGNEHLIDANLDGEPLFLQ